MLLKCIKEDINYGLFLDKIYIPLALYVAKNNVVNVLILTNDKKPFWFDMVHFKQIDDIVPDNFVVKTDFSYNKLYEKWSEYYQVVLLMGYEYLINNPKHFDNLIEYEKEDMEIFRKEYHYVVNKYYYEYTRRKPDIKNCLEFTEPVLVFEEEYIDRDLEYLRE